MTGLEVLIHDSVEAMNKSTREWTARAARGECAWVCSDCCQSDPKGMPDACLVDQDRCTEIIQRDKRDVANGKLYGKDI